MNKPSIRDALLRQEDGDAIDSEMKIVQEMVDKENRRVKRLMTWTLIIWSCWIVAVVLMFAIPVFAAKSNSGGRADRLEIEQNESGGIERGAKATLSAALVAAAIGLPLVGIILLALSITARRAATLFQIRTSLMAIDKRLARLTAAENSQPKKEGK